MMLMRIAGRMRARAAGDEGLGMITVLGIAGVLLVVIAVSITVAVNSLASARNHVQFEAALDTSETGVDELLGKIQTAHDQGLTYTQPANCTANITWSTATVPEPAVEQAWATGAIAAMPAACQKSAGNGVYVAFRAQDSFGQPIPVVYSMGWAPSRTAQESVSRLLKAEYLFSPYKPSQAILTQANLEFSGSVTVDIASGVSASSADVHSNGNVVAGNSSLQVNGSISASGTNSKSGTCPNNKITGDCTAGAPEHAVPVISARELYRSLAASTSQGWYDLCPDGTVRGPDPTGATPCAGTVLSVSGTYRNWTLTNAGTTTAVWTYDYTATDYPGVYYAYQTNVVIGGGNRNKDTVTVSTIAEAKPNGNPGNTATCNKSGGNISWNHENISNFIPGLLMVADGNIIGSANATASRGVIAAGDKLDFNTSSNFIIGSAIASNTCTAAGPNTMQGVSVAYDSTSEVPLSTIVRTTQWLELGGA